MTDVLALAVLGLCAVGIIYGDDILDLIKLWIERKGK